MSGGTTMVLRAAPLLAVTGLILAAEFLPEWRRPGPGRLAVVLDASASVTASARKLGVAEVARRLDGLDRRPHSLAVVAFGPEPRTLGIGAQGPASAWLQQAAQLPGGEATDPARAIELATGLVEAAGGGSILLVTDGVDPKGRAQAAARAAASRGVRLDVLPLVSSRGEVAVESLQLPERLDEGQLFESVVLVRSSVAQPLEVILELDGERVASQQATVAAGALQAFRFVVRAGEQPGMLLARVRAPTDGEAANNVARARLAVAGRLRLAVVGSALAGIDADRFETVPPASVLQRYDAVLLRLGGSPVPGTGAQSRLVDLAAGGRALLVSCDDPGVASELRGGPLDRSLPVRLEPPRSREEEAAIVLLIDRSGSMERTEESTSSLDTARRAADAFVELLRPEDRYGLIAFDVAPHVLRPLLPVAESAAELPPPPIDARGGTDWSPALDLALDWLDGDPAASRHVILVGDGRLGPGADGEPSRGWPDGVTLSTVSVGERSDRERLGVLASRHGGRHDHVSGTPDLPAALRREAARLRLPFTRSGAAALQASPALASALDGAAIRRTGRSLVVTPRDGTETALSVAADQTPILVFGRTGWGSVAFLAVDPGALEGAAQVVQAAVGRVPGRAAGAQRLHVGFDGAQIRVEALVADGEPATVTLREPSGVQRPLALRVSVSGPAQAAFTPLQAGEYVVELGEERARVTIAAPPERGLLPRDPVWYEAWAAAGGGTVLAIEGGEDWPALPVTSRTIDLAPSLIALAALVFFLDSARRLRDSHVRPPETTGKGERRWS